MIMRTKIKPKEFFDLNGYVYGQSRYYPPSAPYDGHLGEIKFTNWDEALRWLYEDEENESKWLSAKSFEEKRQEEYEIEKVKYEYFMKKYEKEI